MTLKRSSSVKATIGMAVAENLRRRIWVIAVTILSFLFLYPLQFGITYSTLDTQLKLGHYGAVSPKDLYLMKGYTIFCPNISTIIISCILAVIIAIQGFSYLNSRKKMDMYESMPVSRSRRFLIAYFNGVLIYLFSYLAAILLTVLLAVSKGAFNGETMVYLLNGMAAHLIAFLGVYNIAVLAVILTGNLVANFLGTLILMFYEVVFRSLSLALAESYFETFSRFSWGKWMKPVFSPVFWLFSQMENSEVVLSDRIVALKVDFISKNVFLSILLALVVFGLAWFLYLRRPSEAAGKTMAFAVTKPFIKVGMIVLGGLLGSVIFYGITDGKTFYVFLGMFIGILLTGGIVQMVYDLDVRSFFKKPLSFGIGAVLSLLIFILFFADLTGYDRYQADEDKVENCSASISAALSKSFIGKKGEEFWGDSFGLQMKLPKEMAPYLNSLMEKRIPQKDMEQNRYNQEITLCWRLSSGREVYRVVWVDFDEVQEELQQICASREYKETVFQLYDEDFLNIGKGVEVDYDNGCYRTTMKEIDKEAFRTAYIKDMEKYDFNLSRTAPVGELTVRLLKDKNDYAEARFPVYDNFDQTLAFLQSQGISSFDEPKEEMKIPRIEVEYYRDEGMEEVVYDDGYYADEYTKEYYDVQKYVTTDPDEIREILSRISYAPRPDAMASFDDCEDNYTVRVFFSTENIVEGNRVYEPVSTEEIYYFTKGNVPENVKQSLGVEE